MTDTATKETSIERARLHLLFSDVARFCQQAVSELNPAESAVCFQAIRITEDQNRSMRERDSFTGTTPAVARHLGQHLERIAELLPPDILGQLAMSAFKDAVSSREGGIPPLELPEKIHLLNAMGCEKLAASLKARLN